MAIVLPRPALLVLYAGSSSLKFAVFPADESLDPSVHGLVDGIGVEPRLTVAGGKAERVEANDHRGALDAVAAWLERHLDGARPAAGRHRLGHRGGPDDRTLRLDEGGVAAPTS